MRLLIISVLLLLPFFSHASSTLKDNEELVFSCDLKGNDRLLAYFNRIEKTLYFLVSGNERQIVYHPQEGMGLDNYQWVRISEQGPGYVPLRFKIDDKRNAYFNLNRAGGYLSIMDAELLDEDDNTVNYICIGETESLFNFDVKRQIEVVDPNEFEAWD